MAAKPKNSTALTKPKVQLPANVNEQLAADMALLSQQLAAPSGKSIQVKLSKEFQLPDGSKVDSFKGVIVSFVSHNAFYEGDFDSEALAPPNCFAIGTVKNDDLDASPNSPDPQYEGDDPSCKNCWANQWKSAAKGNGKACKNSIKLAVLCDDGEVRPLNLSSTALKPFAEYVRHVVQAFHCPPYGVMTEFGFDPKTDYASVRCGSPIKLNDDQLAQVLMVREDANAMLLVEPDVSEFDAKVVALRDKPKPKAKGPTGKGFATKGPTAKGPWDKDKPRGARV